MSLFHNKKMILMTIILMDFLTGMEFDLFVPSFPALQAHFNLSPSWVAALLSVNFLGYCLGLFFLGDLSDRYGRKSIIQLGLVTFIFGSVMCVWPHSYYFLLIGRFLQGLGIAAPAILSFLIIADSYPVKEQQFLMAILNGSMNIAIAFAPVIGSYITLYFHWQGNSAALLILGFIVFLMTNLLVPSQQSVDQSGSVSLNGIRGYLDIFTSKPLVLLMIYLVSTFIPYWIFVGMSSLLYVKDFGVSLNHFGYYQGILALVFAFGSILYGFYIKNGDADQKKMLAISWYIFIASFIAIAGLANSSNPVLITAAMLILVIGQIIPTTILYPICINFMPHAKGRVSAILQGLRLILTAISLQVVSYFYDNTFFYISLAIIAFIIMAIFTQILVTNSKVIMKKI